MQIPTNIMLFTLQDIVIALKKQIPMEVEKKEYGSDYDWTCQKCGKTFEYIRYTDEKSNYCSKCGQAIKWD